jgi:hypothetical protein
MIDPRILLGQNKSEKLIAFFVSAAEKARKHEDNPFNELTSDTKIFSKPKDALKSKTTLREALKDISKMGKLINLFGEIDQRSMYDADHLSSFLSTKLENLPCILNDQNLIVDFGDIKSHDSNPVGIRIFSLQEPNCDNDGDMIRRSKD